MRVNKKDTIYIVLFFLLLFIFFQYGISKIIGFSIFPDEFGYWASAANIIGWDWSETASLGSYYSYGYSLILFPLLIVFESSVTAYKAAVAINMLLMGTAFFLLLKIKRAVYGRERDLKDIILCILALFYPSWIFYMQMTLTEALLMFMFVLIIFLYVQLLEQKKIVYGILFAVSVGYIYVVHMRTVGVVLAACIMMLLMAVTRKEYRKSVLVFGGTLLVAGVLAALIKNNTIQTVYSHADSSHVVVNDYASKWWIFKELLTLSGIVDLFVSLIGKVFYLGCASLGLFYPAMYWLGKQTWLLIYKIFWKKEIKNQEWFGFFLFLSVWGEVMISALGMYRPGNVDGLIYGRYSEFIMPALLLIGVKQMLESKKLFLKCGLTAGITGAVVPLLICVVQSRGMERTRGYHVVGMSYMLTNEYGGADVYLIKSWLFFAALMFLVTVIIHVVRSIKHMEWLLCCIVLIEFALGMHASNHYVYPSNTANHMDRVITDTIQEHFTEDEKILFVHDGRTPYVDFLQMQLREKSIHIVENKELSDCIEHADYLIIYSDMEKTCDYAVYFEERVISNQYTLYYYAKEESTGT